MFTVDDDDDDDDDDNADDNDDDDDDNNDDGYRYSTVICYGAEAREQDREQMKNLFID